MNLYERTRKLVSRGCPEHPRVSWNTCDRDVGPIAQLKVAFLQFPQALCDMENDAPDARDLWTAHALRWAEPMLGLEYIAHLAHLHYGDNILEAIESATRHLEKAAT